MIHIEIGFFFITQAAELEQGSLPEVALIGRNVAMSIHVHSIHIFGHRNYPWLF